MKLVILFSLNYTYAPIPTTLKLTTEKYVFVHDKKPYRVGVAVTFMFLLPDVTFVCLVPKNSFISRVLAGQSPVQ